MASSDAEDVPAGYAMLRVLFADVLAGDGHEVKCVAHGAEALVLLEQQSSFDLILGGLTIPATDGHDAGRIDHPTLRTASVPFLMKPFQPEHLRDVVTRTLARPSAP